MAFKDSIQAATGAAMATPRRRVAARVAGGVVAVLAVFGLAGYFGGPPLIKYLVEKNATEALGRKVTLGGAQVRPFELAATLNDLTIFEPDGKTPMLTLGEVEANTSAASIWHLAPVVDFLHVDRLSVHVVRNADGRMSFADIQERFAAQPPKPADSKPARFSVSNIAVSNSSFVYDDKLLDTVQRVENFTLTLPFLSNLPHDVTINTRPSLFAKINGTPLALDGTSQPFSDSHQTDLNVNLDGLEVAKYMAFAPKLKDAEVKGGLVDTRLKVGFRQEKDTQDLYVSGTIALRDADVRTLAGAPIVKAGRLAVDLDRVQPLAHTAHVKSIELEGFDLQALRRQDGTLNLATAFLPAAAPAPKAAAQAPAKPAAPASAAAAAPASAPAAAGVQAPPKAEEVPWSYAVDRITVKEAKLGFVDELAPSGPGKLDIGPVSVEIGNLASTGDKPAKLDANITVANGQTIRHTGELGLKQGTLTGTLETAGLRPQGFSAWWPRALHSQLGETAVNAELHYTMAWTQPVFQFTLQKSRVELSPVHVATRDPVKVPAASGASAAAKESDDDAKAAPARRGARAPRAFRTARVADTEGANLPLIRADKLILDDIQLDLARQTFEAGQVALVKPRIAATRDRRGQLLESAQIWATESAEQKAADQKAAAKPAPQANGGAAAPGWKVRVGKVAADGGEARLADYAPAEANRGRPVIHQFRNIGLSTGTITWPLSPGALPMKLHAESGRKGVMNVDGQVVPTGPAAQLQLDLRDLDMAPLQPYLADRFNAALRSGTMTLKGKVAYDAPAGKPIAVRFSGNAFAGNVRTVDRISGDDFLRWRALAVNGIDFSMDDAKGPMQVGVSNVALNDFYARVILNANGRLNLQDVMAGGAEKGQAAPSTSLTQASPASAPEARPAQQAAPATEAAGPKPQIRLGGVTINKGNINFSDFFVKPNYSANLTDMKGSVSKVSSADPTPADLVLDGRLDDDAPVSISGKVNPLGEQLYLDIAAKAAGVELTRLTPYAAKYAGYPITKGKLTVDVAYKIENGKLDAKNHLYLDQLTFGDKVDSPDAVKLPVLLAVSLLKDRNGVIDINLPVSGSLSDPEFSIGGVIMRVIVNLLTKAITSPFSLIASAFGGSGEELGYIEFAPGSSTLTDEGRKKIETVGKALNDRPSLRLEISGRIDPATDADGARRVWLDQRVAEAKQRDLRRSAQAGAQAEEGEGGDQGAKVTVSKQEYPKYVEAVYKRESFKKPKNFIGLNKSLPPEEMERLLLENAPVTDAELRALADQRALAVKQSLERDGKVPDSKLFLTAPKLTAEGIKDKGAPNRVDFSIRQ
ncbi:protein of unknown function [Ralstonia sp. 25mfcol4.1]|uniref:DUF748 domain-containing protein n=1 Tax=Burkholderiaceae TaxID=119060 RepID=UPI00088C3B43|nr:DUF748 domain-containing protein [Ralstonia sp. 25mfcol4.1]SDP70122.1 protein of unknown function [Ralstonia sp. 25mfcol4.1]